MDFPETEYEHKVHEKVAANIESELRAEECGASQTQGQIEKTVWEFAAGHFGVHE